MSTYNRQGLAHTRKPITSSMGSSKPRYSLDSAFQSLSPKENRRKLSDTFSAIHASSILTIKERSSLHGLPQLNDKHLGNSQDVWDVMKIPMVFVSISKPSAAIDRLLMKRRTDHEEAMKNMKSELAASYAACEQEFRDRSIVVKIQINLFHEEIDAVRDKLRELSDCDLAWKKVSALIADEKQVVDHFYNSLLKIEKKRQEYSKSILRKYYKIFHKISFLLPYEIQVYLENEILNYNEAVLGNHRIYADLRLKMDLLADTAKMRFKDQMEGLKIDNCEATEIDNQ